MVNYFRMCVRWCCFKFKICEYASPQISQEYCFSPVCSRKFFLNLNCGNRHTHKIHNSTISFQHMFACVFSKLRTGTMHIHKFHKNMISLQHVSTYVLSRSNSVNMRIHKFHKNMVSLQYMFACEFFKRKCTTAIFLKSMFSFHCVLSSEFLNLSLKFFFF